MAVGDMMRLCLTDAAGTVVAMWEVEHVQAEDGSCDFWEGIPEASEVEEACDRATSITPS